MLIKWVTEIWLLTRIYVIIVKAYYRRQVYIVFIAV